MILLDVFDSDVWKWLNLALDSPRLCCVWSEALRMVFRSEHADSSLMSVGSSSSMVMDGGVRGCKVEIE